MNNLTCDGYPIHKDDFAETISTAEKACETSKLIRLARNAGRREGDKELQGVTDRLVLAIHLLDKLLVITKRGEFTEDDINSIEQGIGFVKDPDMGLHRSVRAESGSDGGNVKRLDGSPDGLGEPIDGEVREGVDADR